MLNALKKIKDTFLEIKSINSKQALFRIVDVHEENVKIMFDVQLIGKNVCMRYSQEELLNDLHIFSNISECERVIVKEYGSTLKNIQSYKTSSSNNIRVLNFKKSYIKSYSVDPISQKTVFCIGMESDKIKKTYLMSASEILKNPKLFLVMSPNDRIQIAYHAGMEDIFEEQRYLKQTTRKISTLKSFLNIFSKNNNIPL